MFCPNRLMCLPIPMGVALAHNEKPKGSGVLQVVLGTPVFLYVPLDYYPITYIVCNHEQDNHP